MKPDPERTVVVVAAAAVVEEAAAAATAVVAAAAVAAAATVAVAANATNEFSRRLRLSMLRRKRTSHHFAAPSYRPNTSAIAFMISPTVQPASAAVNNAGIRF